MQQTRRANPYPFTWEVPAAVALAVVLLMILGVHVGRTVANVAAGGGLAFTPRPALFSSLGGILEGNAAAGLGGVSHPASATALWTWIAVVQLMIWAAIAFALKAGLDRWGPSRIRGMATSSEAEKLLGRTRLRKVGGVVRPDLYGKGRLR